MKCDLETGWKKFPCRLQVAFHHMFQLKRSFSWNEISFEGGAFERNFIFISPILGEIKKSGYLLVLCTKRYPDQKYFQYLTGIENIFEHIPYDSNSQLPSLLLVDHNLEVAVAIVWNVRKISSTYG